MALRSVLFSLAFAVLASACAQAPYGDAGIDGPQLEPREFNTSNTGTELCPSELFHYATFNAARCGMAPQSCISNTNTPNRIVCECRGTAPATWNCREQPR